MIVDNPNILVLARKLEQIPNVLQVRFWQPLRAGKAKAAGPGGMAFSCFTREINPADGSPDNFHEFQSIIPASVINNEEYHQTVVDSMTTIIERYFQTGEYPYGTRWEEKGMVAWEPEFPPTPPEDTPTENPPEETPQNP